MTENERLTATGKNLKMTYQYYKRAILFLTIWFITMAVDLYLLDEDFLNFCLKNADTTLDVVKGYRNWYFVLICAGILTVVIQIVTILVMIVIRIVAMNQPDYGLRHRMILRPGGINGAGIILMLLLVGVVELLVALIVDFFAGLVIHTKQPSFTKKQRVCSVFDSDMLVMNIVLIIPIIFFSLIARDERVLDVYRGYVEDVKAIESDELVEDVVFLSNQYFESELIIIGGDYPYIAMCYEATSLEQVRVGLPEWQRIYVPDCLDFTMNEERTYDRRYDYDWNVENTAMYEIQYTPNHQIVVEIKEQK